MKRQIKVFTDPADYETNFNGVWIKGIVVVFDILRATSSMITALANGVEKIYPCQTLQEAFALKKKIPKAILAGERNSFKIKGFDRGNSPDEFLKNFSRELIITTTNGTRALHAAQDTQKILIGAFLNLSTLAKYISKKKLPLSIFCAGTHDDAAEEDILAAGALLHKLDIPHPARDKYIKNEHRLIQACSESKNGRRLIQCCLEKDIAFACQLDRFPLIAKMKNNYILKI